MGSDEKKEEIGRALRALRPLSDSARALIALAADPDHGLSEVVQIIERDARLTIRVLEIANSAAIAPSTPVETVERAVQLMGERAMVAAAMDVGAPWIHAPLAGYGAGVRLFEDGLRTAIASSLLAKRTRQAELASIAYTAGLLHDVGKTILSEMLEPRLTALIEELATHSTGDWLAAERTLVGVDHCEVGAMVADRFKLPATLRAAIEHHHAPRSAPAEHRAIVELVHVADAICAMMGGSGALDALAYRIDPEVLVRLELDAATFGEVMIESHLESQVQLEAVARRGA